MALAQIRARPAIDPTREKKSPMERRSFLRRGLFYTVAAATPPVLSACGGGGSDGIVFPIVPPPAPAPAPPPPAPEPAGRYAFGQGVASGDPKDTSIVFWTRCVRTGTAADSAAIALRLEVSDTSGFGNLVAKVALEASDRFDRTVRAKVTGLSPDTRYFFRFVAGSDVSATGRTRTAPAADSQRQQLRFAWFTCQDWLINHWGALDLLAAEDDLDFTVHVGDYVYETVGAKFQAGVAEPAHQAIQLPNGVALADGSVYANTVDDYRTLYRTYRGDARLQAVHAKFPLIAIWDDHEFSDDCWQDHQTYTNANTQQTARRRGASQAWAEYMPVDFGDVSFDMANPAYDNIKIYRDFRFGPLLHLVMTDERLYRDDHVISEALVAQQTGGDPVDGNSSIGSRYFAPQTTLLALEAVRTQQLGRAPSILGPTQTDWWKTTLKNSNATWKVWGNEVSLSRMWVDLTQMAPPPYNQRYVVNCDAWDGYPSHKADLMGYLKAQNIRNVVAITGDLHAFQCGLIRDLPDPAAGTPVLVDFVCAGVSSSSFYSYIKAGSQGTPLTALTATPAAFEQVMRGNNPDLLFSDHDAQGYASATVTAQAFTVVFNKVKPLDAGKAPASPLLKRTRIRVNAGSTTPVIEDNV